MDRRTNLIVFISIGIVSILLIALGAFWSKQNGAIFIEKETALKMTLETATMHVENLLSIMENEHTYEDPEKTFDEEKNLLGIDYGKEGLATLARWAVYVPGLRHLTFNVSTTCRSLSFEDKSANIRLLRALESEIRQVWEGAPAFPLITAKALTLALILLLFAIPVINNAIIMQFREKLAGFATRVGNILAAVEAENWKEADSEKYFLGQELQKTPRYRIFELALFLQGLKPKLSSIMEIHDSSSQREELKKRTTAAETFMESNAQAMNPTGLKVIVGQEWVFEALIAAASAVVSFTDVIKKLI